MAIKYVVARNASEAVNSRVLVGFRSKAEATTGKDSQRNADKYTIFKVQVQLES